MIDQNKSSLELPFETFELSGQRKLRYVVSSSYMEWRQQAKVWRPPTDVYETQSEIAVRLEVAGMHYADFTISVDNDVLAIRGVRETPQQNEASYHQIEINTGEFMSLVALSAPINVEAIVAQYEDGFLQIKLPKLMSGETRK